MTQQREFRMMLAIAIGLIAWTGASTARAGVITSEPQFGTIADSQSPSELVREGMTKMLEAFDKFVDSVPRYELPQINENGDIILRRKQPQPAPAKPPARAPEPAAGLSI